ncbi:MAG TPA: DUF2252 family protein, partial [Beijerinckiaceae bacterium]|nr:DUF2252 family protein [Beijerinckiaceae bacterium]
DSHLMNFGAFVTPEDNILFDVNDFDETLPGVDFTVDLKRLAASVAVAAADAQASKKIARRLAAATVAAYREHMFDLVDRSPLEIWHNAINLEQEIKSVSSPLLRRKLAIIITRARGKGLDKDDNFVHLVASGDTRIADKPPNVFHFDPDADNRYKFDARHVFEHYRAGLSPDRRHLIALYDLKDLAFKVVGVGSVGTFCCVGLFESEDSEPLFLQVKQAQRSALERLGPDHVFHGHQGQRVVEGQRMMQAATDIFLGWTQDDASGRQFYIRTLKNRRLGGISEIAEAGALSDYAQLCGRTLARAHARTGDPATIAGYMGSSDEFDDALASFAIAYAAQTTSDHAALKKAKAHETTDGNKDDKPRQARREKSPKRR